MLKEMLGATWRLFGQKCKRCHYNTRRNQCAWFEYPEQRRKIETAKDAAEKWSPECPMYVKKHTLNKGFVLGAFRDDDREDYYVEDVDV